MDATIPTRVYSENFRTRLREGKLYLLSDFKVVLPTRILRYSQHPYEIEFTCKTSMDHVRSRSRWNFFHEYDFHMIKIAKPDETKIVVGKLLLFTLVYLILCIMSVFILQCISNI